MFICSSKPIFKHNIFPLMRADLLDEYETKQSREKKSKVVKDDV